MMNTIWLLLLVAGVVTAGLTGRVEAVTTGLAAASNDAVQLAIGFIGIMTFWLGLMKIAEKAGLVDLLARIMRPLTRHLLPGVPPGHPAVGAVLTNVAANMLGLGSAATPLGLKAMDELGKLNKGKKTASDAMCTFLVLNTSAVTVIPATVVALRASAGSSNPAEIVGTTLFATLCSTLAALTADRLLRGRQNG